MIFELCTLYLSAHADLVMSYCHIFAHGPHCLHQNASLKVAKTLKFLNKVKKIPEKEALAVGELSERLLEFGRTSEIVSIQPGISK